MNFNDHLNFVIESSTRFRNLEERYEKLKFIRENIEKYGSI